MYTKNWLILALSLVCLCLTPAVCESKVCFAADGDCGGIETFGGYQDPTNDIKEQCAKAGYDRTRSDCTPGKGEQVTDYCPYDSNYVKCCSLEYQYDSCVYPMVKTGKCGNKYKCVCDTAKYKYTANGSASDCKNNSYAGGASCAQVEYNKTSMTTSSSLHFTDCICDKGAYPMEESKCDRGAQFGEKCISINVNGGTETRYASCTCDTNKYPETVESCKAPSSDKYGVNTIDGHCVDGQIWHYKSCNHCWSDYPATSLAHMSGSQCTLYTGKVVNVYESYNGAMVLFRKTESGQYVDLIGGKYYAKPSRASTCGYAKCPYSYNGQSSGFRYKILNCETYYKPKSDGSACEPISCYDYLNQKGYIVASNSTQLRNAIVNSANSGRTIYYVPTSTAEAAISKVNTTFYPTTIVSGYYLGKQAAYSTWCSKTARPSLRLGGIGSATLSRTVTFKGFNLSVYSVESFYRITFDDVIATFGEGNAFYGLRTSNSTLNLRSGIRSVISPVYKTSTTTTNIRDVQLTDTNINCNGCTLTFNGNSNLYWIDIDGGRFTATDNASITIDDIRYMSDGMSYNINGKLYVNNANRDKQIYFDLLQPGTSSAKGTFLVSNFAVRGPIGMYNANVKVQNSYIGFYPDDLNITHYSAITLYDTNWYLKDGAAIYTVNPAATCVLGSPDFATNGSNIILTKTAYSVRTMMSQGIQRYCSERYNSGAAKYMNKSKNIVAVTSGWGAYCSSQGGDGDSLGDWYACSFNGNANQAEYPGLSGGSGLADNCHASGYRGGKNLMNVSYY